VDSASTNWAIAPVECHSSPVFAPPALFPDILLTQDTASAISRQGGAWREGLATILGQITVFTPVWNLSSAPRAETVNEPGSYRSAASV
jgi:hypothetical protein